MKPYSSPFTLHPTVMVLAALVAVCLFALLPPIGGTKLSPDEGAEHHHCIHDTPEVQAMINASLQKRNTAVQYRSFSAQATTKTEPIRVHFSPENLIPTKYCTSASD
eukprot:Tbor_TRINITY_DN5857_c2_g1::TRINITY_DN5857_c2_g1_i1::g.6737::m.6737